MKSKYSELVKNTILFALGSFGNKVLQFLIVPLYTFVLTTAEYGKIDLFTTTITLLMPFSTLMVQEAIIRFLAANEISDGEAVHVGLSVFAFSCAFSIFAGFLYSLVFDGVFSVIFTICLVLNSYITIFQNYLKACNRIKEYTVCGLLDTFLFLTGNVFFLVVLKKGIWGYLYSRVISLACTTLFITLTGRLFQPFVFQKVDRCIIKKMLFFCIPLIPNSLMWWIMNAGDKYIINLFLGDAANGIYSVSIKLATIITTIFGVFMQAWQLSAIKEYGDEQQSVFYSKIFAMVMALLLLSCSLIITFTRPIFSILISESFFEANLYSPLLCVATILDCMATFSGVSYVVNKNTKQALATSMLGAVVNVFANFCLIRFLGLVGVAVGTVVGYLVVVVFRMINMKKTIHMSFDIARTVSAIGVLALYSVLYIHMNDHQSVLFGVVSTSILFIMYRVEVINILRDLKSMIQGRIIR